PSVGDPDALPLAALAAELEPHGRATHVHVAVPHRRQPERAVLLPVLAVADADQRGLEQPDDESQDLLARQALASQVLLDPHAQARQHRAELKEPAILRFLALRPEPRVIAVLLAPLRIASRRLEMSVRAGTDPDVRPRGGNRERADPRERGGVAERSPFRKPIAESPAGAQ